MAPVAPPRWRDFAISAVSSQKTPLNVYSIFVALYVTGFMMEMVEKWRFPGWTAAAVVLSIVTIVFARQRIVFFVFLLVTTAYFLFARFPEVANHVNLLIFCNILLILGVGYSFISKLGREDPGAYFEALMSPARLMLIVTYFVAGFHKFNHDFINPEVSCIGQFLSNIWVTMKKPLFDEAMLSLIPVVLIVFVIGVPAAILLLRQRLTGLPRWLWMVGMVAFVAIGTLLTTWAYMAGDLSALIESQITPIIMGIAALIVFWQMVEGPMLMIPRLQYIFLCFALLFHTYLGMIGFVDFQSLAMALLLTFVPKHILEAWNEERHMHVAGLALDRVYVYVALNLLAGILSGIHLLVTPLFEPSSLKAMQGLLFNGGVLLLIWPILTGLFNRTRSWRWTGVSVFDGRTPKFLYMMPVLLLLFGMTSHLGLRTAGNFSMFSNLRTEGATSNHFLLGSNPFKFWDYQEDVVRVIELDSDDADIGVHYTPRRLEGLSLPVVEFRKAISAWTERGMQVPIVFEYEGQVYASDDITADPTWRQNGWNWEMRLLDFRAIQPEGPNVCRW